MKELEEITCPLCHMSFIENEKLSKVFSGDPKTKYISNLVKHYREYHITSWNKIFKKYGHEYRGTWFQGIEFEKSKYNNRSKRQIIRKVHPILKEMGIEPIHFERLKDTDQKTMELVHRFLGES